MLNADKFIQAFPAHWQTLFAERAITYVRRHGPSVWPEVYRTDTLADVRKICRQSGIDLEVHADGGISTRYTCPALQNTRRGIAFINNLLPFAWREAQEGRRHGSYVCFADGSPIPSEIVLQIADLGARLGTAIPWQRGDIAMVDNRYMLHGRDEIADQRRTLYLRMADKLRQPPSGPVIEPSQSAPTITRFSPAAGCRDPHLFARIRTGAFVPFSYSVK